MGIIKFLIKVFLSPPKQYKLPHRFNCNAALVYVGNYVVGTNENERVINCKFEVVSGNICTKNLKPVTVYDGTGSSKLSRMIIYPSTDMAEILVHGHHRLHKIMLYKIKDRGHSKLYRQRL